MILVFHAEPEPVYVCVGVSDEVFKAVAGKKDLTVEDGEDFLKQMILVHTPSIMGDFDIYSLVSENDISAAMQEFYVRLFWILAGSFLVVLSYGFIVSKMLQKPVRILSEGFRKVEMGDFAVRLSRGEISHFYFSDRKSVV